MKRTLLIVFALAVVAAFLAFGQSDEKIITKKEVPQAILNAIKKAYPEAKVDHYSVEKEEGKKIYEIGFEQKGRKYEVTYAADGALVEVEETIQADELPAKVKATMEKVFPKYELKVIEKIAEEGKTVYEAKVFVDESGKKTLYELLFSADGKLLKKEKEDEEENE